MSIRYIRLGRYELQVERHASTPWLPLLVDRRPGEMILCRGRWRLLLTDYRRLRPAA